MRRLIALFAFVIVSAAFCEQAAAQLKLEVGLDINPTVYSDDSQEAFSENDLKGIYLGGDIRLDIATSNENLSVLPLIGYRWGSDNGEPMNLMETTLVMHEFTAGVRVRGWIGEWYGIFGQISGGLVVAQMDAQLLNYGHEAGVRNGYEETVLSWMGQALGGVEFRISPKFLERRGIKRFNFGGEIGAGYTRRGDLEFEPDVTGGDEYSLPVNQSADWGTVNPSSFTVQVGITASFF